uniref:WW domain-containing protein n=1 Tax=Panagrolaimus sp. JU765 TaxID=591449 RepID=A0AC34R132_9BILA
MPRDFGPWQERISSKGKIYFYNRVTAKSQWSKPSEWIEADKLKEKQGGINGDGKHARISPPPLPPSIPSSSSRSENNGDSGDAYDKRKYGRHQSASSSSQYSEDTSRGASRNGHSSRSSYSDERSTFSSPSSNGKHRRSFDNHHHRPRSRSSSRNSSSNYNMSYQNDREPSKPRILNNSTVNHDYDHDKTLQPVSISSDDEPSVKKFKIDTTVVLKEPLDGAELISEDEASQITKDVDETVAEEPMEEDMTFLTDGELDNFIPETFMAKIRVPGVDQMDLDLKKFVTKQREIEVEGLEVIKDRVTVRQLYSTLEIEKAVLEMQSAHSSEQCEALSGFGF